MISERHSEEVGDRSLTETSNVFWRTREVRQFTLLSENISRCFRKVVFELSISGHVYWIMFKGSLTWYHLSRRNQVLRSVRACFSLDISLWWENIKTMFPGVVDTSQTGLYVHGTWCDTCSMVPDIFYLLGWNYVKTRISVLFYWRYHRAPRRPVLSVADGFKVSILSRHLRSNV